MTDYIVKENLRDKFPQKLDSNIELTGDEEINDNPIEEVRLTVPITDDPSEPALTFRTWILGFIGCVVLAFVNQFFAYRQNQLYISSVSVQIIALPVGKLMAAYLPSKPIRFPFTKWSFSLNPGPFSLKEHVLITIFASAGAGGVYAVHIFTSTNAFYKRKISPVAAFLLSQTTQMLGYGWAGIFRRYLVESPYMWWPANLVQVSLFRALHDKEKRPKGGTSRLQYFFMIFAASFAYYIVPSYFFPSIAALSFVCWIWKDSITAQQIGGGIQGLGLGSFALDWSAAASFLGSPLATPAFAIVNMFAGFVLTVYILTPIFYWNNVYDAKKFPIFSSHTFDRDGQTYNISRILNEKEFDIDLVSYNSYSKLYLSTIFTFTYGLSFATLSASLTHVAIFHGGTIINLWKKTTTTAKEQLSDVHSRLMKKNYKEVPQWWFIAILVSMVGLALLTCEGFDGQLQLPWWGLLMACAVALIFTLPIGIIQATTNLQPGLNVITEMIIGYIYPGKPLANVAFKTYGYISMAQALYFLSDLKLGHYMKIPPRAMFIIQFSGTLVSSTAYFCTAWWLLESIDNICNPDLLPEGSPWTCPGDDVFYNASIIWGVIGPLRMFARLGVYPELNWFFLVGFLAPFPGWYLSRKYPNKKWLSLIHTPILLGATGNMPPARAVNYWVWAAVGLFFNAYIFKRYKSWWARHNYILSAALDAGVAFTAVILFFALQSKDIVGPNWWGLDSSDHCDLAACPTAPGIVSEGCPVL
ncbi:oligopeptide transporter 1-like [Quercus robur]|uniref:oligopeptide transporter 1-like n=1 Tax=Quercus robur TaxID=38942 RepID=UPI002162A0EE|nr:oligopeptide transporter 1-like [Quercus robur]